MEKISQHYLEQLKGRFDLAEVVGKLVPGLRSVGGGDYQGKCPFHDEDTGSFRVNKLRYHCFGCHAHGDIFSWTQKTTGRTFPQAVQFLGQGNAPEPQGEAIPRREAPNHSPYESGAVMAILEANAMAQAYFLGADMDQCANDYLFSRFTGDDMDRWGVGYGPNARDWLSSHLAMNEVDPDLACKAGLIAQSPDGSWYDRLRDRAIIPLRDRSGYIRGFTGRIIPRPDNGKLPKYSNSPTTWAFQKKRYLFGLEQFDPTLKYAIVVEGPMDVISMYRAGHKNVLAAMGSELSDEQLSILETLTPRIFVMMDGDAPGLEATFRASRNAMTSSSQMFHILLSDDVDPDIWASLNLPLRSLPIIKATDFYQPNLVLREMKKEYDRSLLDKLIEPYVMDNIRSGYPHYNVVDWVMAAYPQYAQEIKEKTLGMVTTAKPNPDTGVYTLTEVAIKEFIKAWMKPSRDVRKVNENKKIKR